MGHAPETPGSRPDSPLCVFAPLREPHPSRPQPSPGFSPETPRSRPGFPLCASAPPRELNGRARPLLFVT